MTRFQLPEEGERGEDADADADTDADDSGRHDHGCTDIVAVSSAITLGETGLIQALTCPESPSSGPVQSLPAPPPPIICNGPEEIVQPEIAASPMPGLTPAATGTVNENGFTDDFIVGPTGGSSTRG